MGESGAEMMEDSISPRLRVLFLIHACFTFVLGVLLWSIPGRTLTVLGWVPEALQFPGTEMLVPGTIFVDPGLTRLLGAALLAIAFSSYQGWRAHLWSEVTLLVRLKFIFALLGLLGILLGGVFLRVNPDLSLLGWLFVIVLGGFTIAWGLVLSKH